MSDIVLSSGVRSNLLQLQQTADLVAKTQERLSSGRRVNSALDNPTNFFTAQNLSNRANDLNALLDGMSTAINTLQSANNGLTGITKLIQTAQSLVTQAQQTSDPTVRASLAAQFDSLRTQVDQLAGDAGINGINLLAGDTLTVALNEKGTSSVAITGLNMTTGGALSVSAASNSWASAGDVSAAATQLTTALTTLRAESQGLNSQLQTVQIRQEFTKSMVNTLQTGADNLTLADSNEEGANLLALQTRQQLSTTALSLASQADQNVLRLFQ
jgi:flagellin-like hook-associated protein FlgL